jgi:hypothetical protein
LGEHGKYWALVRALRPVLYAFAACAGLTAPAAAQDCRLALLLALDVSASVDRAEYNLQRDGLISAFLSPEVQAGFLNGPGDVALGVFEWSGRFQQNTLVDWIMIRSEADLLDVTARLSRTTRGSADFPTAIGYALGYASSLFDRAPPCLFNTLDVSGDGQNNDGFPPDAAYQHFDFEGITVNGLAIGGASREIAEYFTAQVIRGPGAFVEYAETHFDFETTMRRKLERELQVMILGSIAP